MTKFSDLCEQVKEFSEAREWGQFHSPKNLSMALTVEAAELLEHFQWMTEQQSASISGSKREEVANEIADILIYLIRISDRLNIDVLQAAFRKLEQNALKYPVDKARGNSRKYSEFNTDKPA